MASIVAVLAGSPSPSAQRASARLLVLNKEDATLAIVDPVSGSVLGRVPVGQGPHELVTSTDGKTAFASHSARKTIRRIPVGRTPEGILIPPSGGVAYIAVNGDNFVAVIDLETWQVTKKISTGTGPDGMAWIP